MTTSDKPTCGSSEELLAARQAYSLQSKIAITEMRIKEWYERYNGKVYVAFSGGKDSAVLRDMVLRMYPDVPCVFVNTGLEYPEIVDFVRTCKDVVWLKPGMSFKRVIEKYGYPVVSKVVSRFVWDLRRPIEVNRATRNLRLTGYNRKGIYCPSMKMPKKWLRLVDAPFLISEKCCDVMKKQPAKAYAKKTGRMPYIGTMVGESLLRRRNYLRWGCNAFDLKNPTSTPMSFWKTSDVWEYIKLYDLPYSKIYDMGEDRTGCMACMFGVHMEKGSNRFQRMKKSHPKHWNAFINGMGLGKVLEYIGIEYGKNDSGVI